MNEFEVELGKSKAFMWLM